MNPCRLAGLHSCAPPFCVRLVSAVGPERDEDQATLGTDSLSPLASDRIQKLRDRPDHIIPGNDVGAGQRRAHDTPGAAPK